MNLEKFQNLDEEKKQRIIKAAIEEFVENGYIGASTNNIVKNAEISKGSLFNYFDNKEKLFIYLFNYTIGKVINNFQNVRENLKEVGLLEGIKLFIDSNIKFFTTYPKEFQFLAKGMTNSPEPLRSELLKTKRELQKNVIEYLVQNSSGTKFRNDVAKEKISFFILTLLDNMSNIYIEKYSGNIELLLADKKNREEDIREYLELVKFGVWNREEK